MVRSVLSSAIQVETSHLVCVFATTAQQRKVLLFSNLLLMHLKPASHSMTVEQVAAFLGTFSPRLVGLWCHGPAIGSSSARPCSGNLEFRGPQGKPRRAWRAGPRPVVRLPSGGEAGLPQSTEGPGPGRPVIARALGDKEATCSSPTVAPGRCEAGSGGQAQLMGSEGRKGRKRRTVTQGGRRGGAQRPHRQLPF